MNDALLLRASVRGYLTRPEILDSGYDDRDIREARSIGLLTRIGAGLYALTANYKPLTPQDRHRVRSRAVAHRLGDGVVLTHQSAALQHGIPVWGVDLDEVHVTRRDGKRGRHEAGVYHHIGRIGDSDIDAPEGVLVSKPNRAVWEVACATSIESAIVTADGALHDHLVVPESLHDISAHFANWQGSRSARVALTLADGRAESPGESRTRHMFWRFGIPKPDLQYVITDDSGLIIARADFAWELYRHLAEFDGRIKYDGTFSPAGFGTVFDEKVREDLVRAQSWGMSRIIWANIHKEHAASTASRVMADLERSRGWEGGV